MGLWGYACIHVLACVATRGLSWLLPLKVHQFLIEEVEYLTDRELTRYTGLFGQCARRNPATVPRLPSCRDYKHKHAPPPHVFASVSFVLWIQVCLFIKRAASKLTVFNPLFIFLVVSSCILFSALTLTLSLPFLVLRGFVSLPLIQYLPVLFLSYSYHYYKYEYYLFIIITWNFLDY